MIYNLNNPYEKDEFRAVVDDMIAKKAVVELKRKYPKRTLKQNSYLHLILSYFASQYGCTATEAKEDYFKTLCNPTLFIRKKINRFGFEITYRRSSRDLDTREMTIAIESFRNWAAQFVYIPAPNEHEALLYAEREVEKNKEFINIDGEIN